MRDGSGQDSDPVLDRQTLVHQEQRSPLDAAEPTSRRGDVVVEWLDPDFDTEAFRKYLEFGKHARGRHEAKVTAALPRTPPCETARIIARTS